MRDRLQNAVRFVRHRGRSIDRLRLEHLLSGDRAALAAVENEMARLQNPDGGWGERPYGVPIGPESNLTNTYMALRLLIEDLGSYRSASVERGVRYVLSQRTHDGRFDDAPASLPRQTPGWMKPGKESVIVWKTAAVVNTLLQLPADIRPDLRPACDYLLELYRSKDLFSGYYHASWWVMAIAAHLHGPESEIARRCARFLEQKLPALPIHEDYLHALEACATAGFPSDHPLVRTCLRLLDQSQNPDGSWTNEFGEIWSVDVTLRVLRMNQFFRGKE